jgi:hypothetical protein
LHLHLSPFLPSAFLTELPTWQVTGSVNTTFLFSLHKPPRRPHFSVPLDPLIGQGFRGSTLCYTPILRLHRRDQLGTGSCLVTACGGLASTHGSIQTAQKSSGPHDPHGPTERMTSFLLEVLMSPILDTSDSWLQELEGPELALGVQVLNAHCLKV